MKISYDAKTDFMSIRLENVECYVEDFLDGVDAVLAEEDDRVVGYDLYNARKTIISFKEVTSSQKLAMLIKLYRKRSNMTQEDLNKASGIPLPTIKMIEKGEKETSIENVSKLKRALPEIDLNSISISKLAS
ncbi:MAG: DNA-binding XRE family transcriptional regulator [Bacteriovoracaceae bacterium]|jgi:DNA-binding XRE family transcriptional regulator